MGGHECFHGDLSIYLSALSALGFVKKQARLSKWAIGLDIVENRNY
jgi:hypothetical protein